MDNSCTLKPHYGVIENYEIHYVDAKYLDPEFPPNERFIVWGNCESRFNGRRMHTSLVIKREGNEIETLNSRYTLGEPRKVVTQVKYYG